MTYFLCDFNNIHHNRIIERAGRCIGRQSKQPAFKLVSAMQRLSLNSPDSFAVQVPADLEGGADGLQGPRVQLRHEQQGSASH